MEPKVEFYMLFNKLCNGAWQPIKWYYDYKGVELFSQKFCERMKLDCQFAICKITVTTVNGLPKVNCTLEHKYTLFYDDED